MTGASFIAVDWGSSTFRAWAIDQTGATLAARSGPEGLKSVKNRDFAEVISRHCGDWLSQDPTLPVLMQGMVGARTGWVEAAYAPCPVQFPQITAQATRFTLDSHPVAILPGATTGDDVMRGEEVQIFGALALTGQSDTTICIPGTHSKWARVQDGTLTDFATFVTGELYQLLLNNSLVGALAEGTEAREDAFRRGLDRGATLPLSNAVFAARASTLTGAQAPEDVASFLSGVLIGAEVACQPDGPVLLMASGILAERYGATLDHFGRRFDTVDAGAATLSGLTQAAAHLWPDAIAHPVPA